MSSVTPTEERLWVCMCLCAHVTNRLQCRTESDSFLRSSSPCESDSIWHCYPVEGWKGNKGSREWMKEGGEDKRNSWDLGAGITSSLLLPNFLISKHHSCTLWKHAFSLIPFAFAAPFVPSFPTPTFPNNSHYFSFSFWCFRLTSLSCLFILVF